MLLERAGAAGTAYSRAHRPEAISWLHGRGYEKVYMYGISEGAKLALLCASLMRELSGVVALSPIHCLWGGMKGNKSMSSKTFTSTSEFTYKGKDFPCMTAELTYGPAIKNLLLHHQLELSYIYERPLAHFDERTAIPVENINGDILFIYAGEDLVWPSGTAVQYMVKRLKTREFTHQVEALEYEKASHILVPLNPDKLKMWKAERKYPEECRRSREDAFDEVIAWVLSR